MNAETLVSSSYFDANSLDSQAYIELGENLATIIKNSVTEIQLADIEIQLIVLAINSKKSQSASHIDELLKQIITVIHRSRHPFGSE